MTASSEGGSLDDFFSPADEDLREVDVDGDTCFDYFLSLPTIKARGNFVVWKHTWLAKLKAIVIEGNEEVYKDAEKIGGHQFVQIIEESANLYRQYMDANAYLTSLETQLKSSSYCVKFEKKMPGTNVTYHSCPLPFQLLIPPCSNNHDNLKTNPNASSGWTYGHQGPFPKRKKSSTNYTKTENW
jgi:hypothetical protein